MLICLRQKPGWEILTANLKKTILSSGLWSVSTPQLKKTVANLNGFDTSRSWLRIRTEKQGRKYYLILKILFRYLNSQCGSLSPFGVRTNSTFSPLYSCLLFASKWSPTQIGNAKYYHDIYSLCNLLDGKDQAYLCHRINNWCNKTF